MSATAFGQSRFGAEPERKPSASRPSSAASGVQRGAAPYRDAQAERCANFREELRDARRRERQAGTTTSSDQASLHRQDVLEQAQKAGC